MGKPGLGAPSLLLVLLALVVSPPGRAQATLAPPAPPAGEGADESASCAVRSLLGKPGGHEIDPQLAFMRQVLSRPPLSSFGFRQLDKHEVVIGKNTPATFPVPGDHVGVLAFHGWTEGPKRRVRVRLTIKDGSAKLMHTQFLIDNGGMILQGGINYDNGILFLAITCHLPG